MTRQRTVLLLSKLSQMTHKTTQYLATFRKRLKDTMQVKVANHYSPPSPAIQSGATKKSNMAKRKTFTPIIETGLRAWEKIPGSQVVSALNITPGNATTKKENLTTKLLEIWKVFDFMGVQIWAIPDEQPIVRKVANLITEPNLSMGAHHMQHLQSMVFHFPVGTPEETITQLLHSCGAQMITVEHLPHHVVATLIFNQTEIFV